jgi:hypothetical protein
MLNRDKISMWVSPIVNTTTILYFTMFSANVYFGNWMVIYEILMWLTGALTIAALFGFEYIKNEGNYTLEKLQELKDKFEKSNTPIYKLITFYWYITIGVVGIIGGDLSLFIPMLTTAVSIYSLKKNVTDYTLELEEKTLRDI